MTVKFDFGELALFYQHCPQDMLLALWHEGVDLKVEPTGTLRQKLKMQRHGFMYQIGVKAFAENIGKGE